eukprot:TRINITY_DN373_c0_g3_i1.p1 TRINITY_DN373_c0_g3~~TRINITY_DN373_c0_g3_i1.p1  ORF type:complete len:322 (-),score=26.49 TRINITY_DN373_c0_g3_i1:258-1157(-)
MLQPINSKELFYTKPKFCRSISLQPLRKFASFNSSFSRGITAQVAISDNDILIQNASIYQDQDVQIDIGVVKSSEYWAAAQLHCRAFYPNQSGMVQGLLELDRVVALQDGHRMNKLGYHRFSCLVARLQDKRSWGEAAEIHGEFRAVQLGLGRVLRSFLPPLGATGFGFTYKSLGLCGAVVVDTMGIHLPKKKVRKDGRVIGYEARKDVGYISNLASSPDLRRKGIGRKLLQQAERLCACWGCRYVALHVESDNEAAEQLYKRQGYRIVKFKQRQQAPFSRAFLTLMVKRVQRVDNNTS